jgi:glycosyltransferase involved in cell wall biosynthesis
MNTEKNPKVSIGLPVYNGENYIRQSVDSILAQTFTDFELIISDNASTDQTGAICLEYAQRDLRICYHRNPTNIGGANNHNRTFQLSRGKYFRWAGYDDIFSPELLEKTVKVLDEDPSIVLAHTITQQIDQNGKDLRIIPWDKGKDDSPSVRFRDLSDPDHYCEAANGLIRSEIMKKTDLLLNYTDSDRTFLTDLALYGKFFQVKEILFYKRYHPMSSTHQYPSWRDRMSWYRTNATGRINAPYLMQFFHFLRIIQHAPISLKEKISCYTSMFTWMLKYQRWKKMIKDIILVLFYPIHRFLIQPVKKLSGNKSTPPKSQLP